MIVQAFGGASAARAVSQGTDATMVCTSSIISWNIHFIEIGRQYYARRNCRPALCVTRVSQLSPTHIPYLRSLVAIVVYVTLAAEFFLRLKRNAPFRHVEQPRVLEKGQHAVSNNLRILLCAMAFCTLCIFIRLVPSASSCQRS